MRPTLAALTLAAGLSVPCWQTASALPIDAASIQQAATAASSVAQIQYAERRTKRGYVKCYREFVVGNYACHKYRNW